tara:strand:+ start:13 stop:1932 length:1920 start_codon:yes stop_codon:yes gene_type:complete
MNLSPVDFAAYSRATGAPYPESPEEQMEMYPLVRDFRKNQLQPPQQQESNSLALGLGIGLGLAGLGAGALALRKGKKMPKKTGGARGGQSGIGFTDIPPPSSPPPGPAPTGEGGGAISALPSQTKAGVFERVKRKFPDVPGEQELIRAYAPEARRAEEHAIKFGYSDLNPADRKLTNLETGEIYSRGRSPDVPQPKTFLDNQVNELLSEVSVGEAGQMLAGPEVAAEAGQMMGTESSRQSAVVRRLEREEEKQAKNILSELAQETPTLTETYETFGEPAARIQSIDAVDTASDQLDSRFESTVQRDVDSVFEGKVAVANEKLGTYGPLSAEDTAALARDQMINLRAELEAEGLRPGSTRYERALAERFKTGETTKIGELGITGSSLNKATLPAGPMRQTMQSVETSQSPTFTSRSVENVGGNPSSDLTEAASGTSIRGRSRIQNEPEQFRQRVDSKQRRIDDEFGVELTELDIDTEGPKFSRQVIDPVTGKLTPEFAPKGQRVVQLYQGEGQPTKAMYVPEADPGGVGIYGEERSFASGPISKFGESAGEYTKTAQRKPTELPYLQKKGGDLTDMSTSQLQTFASNAVKKNPKAAQAAMSELERRETSKLSMQASEAVRRANIEGRDPQMVLRSMGFGV